MTIKTYFSLKICLGVLVSAIAIPACKDAEFSGASRKKSATDVVRTGGPGKGGDDALGGKPGSGDPEGPNSINPDDSSTTSPDGKPPGTNPDGTTTTNPGGKPPITSEDGSTTTPNNPIAEENGPVSGPQSEVTVVGLRADSNDMPLTLHIKKRDGSWGEVQWPRKGGTVKLEGVCNSKKDVVVEIKTTLRGSTYVPTSTSCFVGKQENDSSVHVGFEHDCNSTNYNKIDDTIAKFSCPDKGFKIDSLRLDPGIDLREWID